MSKNFLILFVNKDLNAARLVEYIRGRQAVAARGPNFKFTKSSRAAVLVALKNLLVLVLVTMK